jgi:DNA-binding response OmpR family regulator
MPATSWPMLGPPPGCCTRPGWAAIGRLNNGAATGSGIIRAGELAIDPDTYAAKLKGRPLDLTYKEFELLKFLAQHPGRVFTRDQLLREVWGYDYFGGTRTVDVHVRRLRAKLGSEYESMIGTVRQVGYKFVVPPSRMLGDPGGNTGVIGVRERSIVPAP